MGRDKYVEEKEQLVTQHTKSSVRHVGGSVTKWACMVANGMGSLVFTGDGTGNRSCKMISIDSIDLYSLLTTARMALDSAEQ